MYTIFLKVCAAVDQEGQVGAAAAFQERRVHLSSLKSGLQSKRSECVKIPRQQ